MSASLMGDNSLGVTAKKTNSWPKSRKGWENLQDLGNSIGAVASKRKGQVLFKGIENALLPLL